MSDFLELHRRDDLFVMPNAWDVGSARILEAMGFPAIATTSSGHAASLGRLDQQVERSELLDHVSALVEAIDIPLSVDAEHGFADDPGGVATTIRLLADIGAAGVSIEDYHPNRGLLDIEEATRRVAAAVSVADEAGVVLTARAENHLYDVDDLDDTIARLVAYRDAGAHVLYAPGLADIADIRRLVDEVSAPVNVLLWPGGPTVSELAAVGVRRVSTGGALAGAAYGALEVAAAELRDDGTTGFLSRLLASDLKRQAFTR